MNGQRETLDLDSEAGGMAFGNDDHEPEINADFSRAVASTIAVQVPAL